MKVFKKIILGVAVTLLFLTTMALFILIPIKHSVGKNSLQHILNEISVGDIIADSPEIHEEIKETLKPIIEETAAFGIDDAVIEDTIVKIVDSPAIKGVVASVTSNIIDYALTGQEHKIITSADVTTIVDTTVDSINESNLGIEIDDATRDKLNQTISEHMADIEEYIPDVSTLDIGLSTEEQNTLNVIHFLLSNNFVIILAVIALASVLAIVLIKQKEARFIKWVAIPLLITSGIALMISIILYFGVKMVLPPELNSIYPIFGGIVNNYLGYSGITFVLMIIALIGYHIYRQKTGLKTK